MSAPAADSDAEPRPENYRKHSVLSIVMCAIGALWFAAAFSNGWPNMTELGLAGLWVAIWGVAWLARIGAYISRVRDGRQKPNRTWRHWCLEPVVLLALVVLAMSGVFTEMRLRWSAAAMEKYARERIGQFGAWPTHPGPKGDITRRPEKGRRLGLYEILESEILFDGGVRFRTKSFLFGKGGFDFYAGGRKPSTPAGDQYRHVYGGWYQWKKDGHLF
jgi:hypothetical protein